MTRKAAADSTAGKIAIAQAEHRSYDIPEGLEKLTKSERIAWNQYLMARTDWKEGEFRTIHRIVKLESWLKKITRESKQIHPVYIKGNGDPAPHPIHAEVRATAKMLHAELKLVGLQVDSTRAGIVGKDGVKAKESSRGKKLPTAPSGMSLVG